MTNTTEPTKRIIKIEQCPTLSGKETLTYHIGCDDKEAIYFQMVSNSNNGFFNDLKTSSLMVVLVRFRP